CRFAGRFGFCRSFNDRLCHHLGLNRFRNSRDFGRCFGLRGGFSRFGSYRLCRLDFRSTGFGNLGFRAHLFRMRRFLAAHMVVITTAPAASATASATAALALVMFAMIVLVTMGGRSGIFLALDFQIFAPFGRGFIFMAMVILMIMVVIMIRVLIAHFQRGAV